MCSARTATAECMLELMQMQMFNLASAAWSVCVLHWLYGQTAAACRTVSDIIPKERSNGLPVFTQALRLVPFSMPDHWSGPRLCEDLPGQYISLWQIARPCLTAFLVIANLGRTPGLSCAFFSSLHCSPFPFAASPTLAQMLTCSHPLLDVLHQLPKPLLPAAAATYAMTALLQA